MRWHQQNLLSDLCRGRPRHLLPARCALGEVSGVGARARARAWCSSDSSDRRRASSAARTAATSNTASRSSSYAACRARGRHAARCLPQRFTNGVGCSRRTGAAAALAHRPARCRREARPQRGPPCSSPAAAGQGGVRRQARWACGGRARLQLGAQARGECVHDRHEQEAVELQLHRLHHVVPDACRAGHGSMSARQAYKP